MYIRTEKRKKRSFSFKSKLPQIPLLIVKIICSEKRVFDGTIDHSLKIDKDLTFLTKKSYWAAV